MGNRSEHRSHDVTAPKRYRPVGCCIYCGATKDLTEEHIVPYALNGAWVLPASSCSSCRRVTGAFEQDALRIGFTGYRIQKNFRTRRPKERKQMKVQVTRHKDGAVKEVFYDEYENSPKCLMHMRLQPPGILVGRDKSYGIHPAMSMLINSDVPDWANRLRVAFATVIQPYDHTSVARMLAKIGHAYACAECTGTVIG